ncbi:MAG: ABC transporter ATP-binding protein/permease [Candidatus Sumerlaeaceae bacterium]|nr:ABC transporter ATP-binding protein/permease [Candidatus Sumerlaeaceae bacterium]
MNRLAALLPYVMRHKLRILAGLIFIIITNYLAVRVARVVGNATDAMKTPGATSHDFLMFALWIVGLTFVAGTMRFFTRQWIVGASRDFEFEFRNEIFRKLQSLTPSFYDRQRTGELMTLATNDVEAVRLVMGPGIMQFCNSVIILPLAVGRMMLINWWLTLITMLPVALVPIFVNYFGNRIHRRFRAVQDNFASLSAMVQENLAGMRVVKAFVQEQPQKDKFNAMSEDYVGLNMKLARVQAGFFPVLRMLLGLSMVLLILVGGQLVLSNQITVGNLVEFSLIELMMFWPLIALGWTISLMQRGAASLERIEEIMKLEPEVLTEGTSANASISRGEVELRNLNFRYRPELPLVLKDISFYLKPGARLGIIGPTGSGKSSLASLLVHLYKVDRGQILLDGSDINDIPLTELRDRVSLVFQETFLFSDTIANNIAFGLDEPDEDEIRGVARQAHIAEEIERFPAGYGTMLGERGINLSGGQKQRTAIARAIVRDPRILILDDALSAVDTETEGRIIDSLEEVLKGRTAIIIAHRISAVRHCDEIIVLSEGAIAERGTHDELVALGGLYESIHQNQLLADAVEADA